MGNEKKLAGETGINKSGLNGLCVNCDDSDICRFETAEQNVIFCEEYKPSIIQTVNHRDSRNPLASIVNLSVKKLVPGWS